MENSNGTASSCPNITPVNPMDARQPLAGIVAIPAWMVAHPEIDSTSFRVYCYLVARFNRRTNLSYPSARTIGEGLDLSIRSVRRCIKHLRLMGLIAVRGRQWGNGSQKSNGYVPLFSAWDNIGWEPKQGQQGHPQNLGADDHRAVIRDTGDTPPGDSPDPTPGDTHDSPRGVQQVSPLEPIESNGRTIRPPQPPHWRGGALSQKLTRDEKALISKLSTAVGKTCGLCHSQITEHQLATRDSWGILKGAVAQKGSGNAWRPTITPADALYSDEAGHKEKTVFYALACHKPMDRNVLDLSYVAIRQMPDARWEVWCKERADADTLINLWDAALTRAMPEGWTVMVEQKTPPEDSEEWVHTGCTDES